MIKRLYLEKILKSEISEILKSDDFKVGAEFEFLLDSNFWTGLEYRKEIIKKIEKILGKTIVFTKYHQAKKEKNINYIEPDPSIGDEGVEVVTRVMSLSEFKIVLKNMLNFIKKEGYTIDKTGLHISISTKQNMKNIDVLKLLIFQEEGNIYKMFKDRKDNAYVRSVKLLLKTIKSGEHLNEFVDMMETHKYDEINEKLSKKLNIAKYFGVNLSKLMLGYIEFRYLGGKDYEKKYDNIIYVLATYLYNIKLAIDKKFKLEEYLKKLWRLFDLNKQFSFQQTVLLKKLGIKELKGNLTLDMLKEKFGWILDAQIKDAILSYDIEQSVYLSWHRGTWNDGTWNDGTWHRGYWRDGTIYSNKFKIYTTSKVSPKEFYDLEKQANSIEELKNLVK